MVTMEESPLPTTRECITALNNQAIELVQEGDSRNAIKLFLEALSRLKSDIPDHKKEEGIADDRKGDNAVNEEETTAKQDEAQAQSSWFVSLSMTATDAASEDDDNEEDVNRKSRNTNKNKTSSLLSSSIDMYEYLLDFQQDYDPTLPENRDGATTLLLYNLGATHHIMGMMGFETEKQQLMKSSLHFKKAANTYNMALSAARHWKRFATNTYGYQFLSCAIFNNQWQIQRMLHDPNPSSTAVSADHIATCLREVLKNKSAKAEMSQEEFNLFSKNLQVKEDSKAAGVSDSNKAACKT